MIQTRIQTAAGECRAELVFKNATVVDVFAHHLRTCDVAVADGRIVGLGEYTGGREVDATGKYLLPGLIDSHIHIESSTLAPGEFARAVLPWGVTSVIADPHEIMNVCGEAGLRYMRASAEGVPLDVYFMLPSCVPATPFDSAGYTINGAETRRLMEAYACLGLGEMMNVPGLLGCDGEVLEKLSCAERVDGHAPLLSGRALNAYICGGVSTDHECTSAAEALEKLSKGMYIHMREGTGARDLAALIPAVGPHTQHRMTFCTDDKHIDELMEEGTIAHCIAKSVALGVDPVDAISMATLHPAQCYGLKGRGAIAPDYFADLLLCEDLCAKTILEVYKDGVLVAKDGKPLFHAAAAPALEVCNTVHVKPMTAADFHLEFEPSMPVIELCPHSLITKKTFVETTAGLNLCANIERHHATGRVGKAFIKGLDLVGGAVAQSIGHDAHNITVAGDREEDMLLAVQALGQEGGIAVVSRGKVTARLPLPIAGLMSDRPAEEVLEGYRAVSRGMAALCGAGDTSRLMILSFLSLLVIPALKLNDRGLFDVEHQCFL